MAKEARNREAGRDQRKELGLDTQGAVRGEVDWDQLCSDAGTVVRDLKARDQIYLHEEITSGRNKPD